jgi:hypothetical protein
VDGDPEGQGPDLGEMQERCKPPQAQGPSPIMKMAPASAMRTPWQAVVGSDPLDDDSRRHAASGAHGHEAALQVAPLKLVNHRADED